jgi:predicted choloylglycine hydrolase
MCTLAAKKLGSSWFLIKTRDPVPWMRWDDEIKIFDSPADKFKKLIIQNPNPNEDGYYGGINENGVAFVATYLPVAENQVSYIRRPYVRLILDAGSAKEAVKKVKSFNPKIGGNFLVADEDECYEIESAPQRIFIKKINKVTAKTNHFLHLPFENLQMKNPWFANWTKRRLERAQILIEKAKSLKDLENILKDRKNSETASAICMLQEDSKENPPTSSAFIFDSGKKIAYYCQGNPLGKPFKEYRLS